MSEIMSAFASTATTTTTTSFTTTNLRKFVDGCSCVTPAQPAPDPAEVDVSGGVDGIDVLVGQEEASQDFDSRLFAQIIQLAELVDQVVDHRAEVVRG